MSLYVKKAKEVALVAGIAFLSMGNQSCEQAQNKPRVLRMDVEVGAINARPVQLPSGETIDFPYVVNTLFYRQVMSNDHFILANPVPSPASFLPTQSSGLGSGSLSSAPKSGTQGEDDTSDVIDSAVSKTDVQLLARFGFVDKLRKAAAEQQVLSSEFGIYGLSGKASTTAAGNDAELPACLYDMPQATLAGDVISFEATWGIGLGIGYGANGAPLNGGAAGKVDFSQSKLEIGLRSDDPLKQTPEVIASGISNQSKVNFGLSFGGLPLGIGMFFNTPLADVIRKSMDRGLDKIVESYIKMKSTSLKWDDVWESRVIYDPEIVDNDTHIAFRGGYLSNVQMGDKFTVTNLHYKWEGAACETRLKYKIPMTTTPVAELEVVSVGDNVSVARVTKYLVEQKIKPGAQIKILQLKQPVPPADPKAKK